MFFFVVYKFCLRISKSHGNNWKRKESKKEEEEEEAETKEEELIDRSGHKRHKKITTMSAKLGSDKYTYSNDDNDFGGSSSKY